MPQITGSYGNFKKILPKPLQAVYPSLVLLRVTEVHKLAPASLAEQNHRKPGQLDLERQRPLSHGPRQQNWLVNRT